MNSQSLVAFFVGLIFSVGLALGGMTQPHKVIDFLNFSNWDPTLLFVMIGAIAVHGVAFFFIKKRKRPVLDFKWHFPTNQKIDRKLLIGAFIFGLGWGLGGYCPGPAITSLSTLSYNVVGFVLMMLAGMKVANILTRS